MKIKTVPAFVLFICIAFLSGCVSQNPNAIWFSPNKTAEQEREDMAECRNEARLGTPPDYNQQTLGQAFVTGYFQGQRENTIFTDCMISKGYELETNTPEIKQVLQLKRGMSQVEVVKLLGNPQYFCQKTRQLMKFGAICFPLKAKIRCLFRFNAQLMKFAAIFIPLTAIYIMERFGQQFFFNRTRVPGLSIIGASIYIEIATKFAILFSVLFIFIRHDDWISLGRLYF